MIRSSVGTALIALGSVREFIERGFAKNDAIRAMKGGAKALLQTSVDLCRATGRNLATVHLTWPQRQGLRHPLGQATGCGGKHWPSERRGAPGRNRRLRGPSRLARRVSQSPSIYKRDPLQSASLWSPTPTGHPGDRGPPSAPRGALSTSFPGRRDKCEGRSVSPTGRPFAAGSISAALRALPAVSRRPARRNRASPRRRQGLRRVPRGALLRSSVCTRLTTPAPLR